MCGWTDYPKPSDSDADDNLRRGPIVKAGRMSGDRRCASRRCRERASGSPDRVECVLPVVCDKSGARSATSSTPPPTFISCCPDGSEGSSRTEPCCPQNVPTETRRRSTSLSACRSVAEAPGLLAQSSQCLHGRDRTGKRRSGRNIAAEDGLGAKLRCLRSGRLRWRPGGVAVRWP